MKIKIIAVVAVLGLLMFFVLRRGGAKVTPQEYKVVRGGISKSVSANGTVRPRNRLEIKPPFSGRIDRILVSEGDTVKKGDVLSWMSSQDRAALLDAARAKGADAVAKWNDVYKPTPVIAPISGFIIKRSFEPGQTVSASDALLVMADSLIIEAQVDETDIGKLKIGQIAEILLDAYPSDMVRGNIEHIAYESEVINNVTVYRVKIAPAGGLALLRSGMSANIDIKLEEKNDILILSAAAVKKYGTKEFVSIKNDAGEIKRRNITTGISDGVNVEIVSGLEEGELVTMESRPSSQRSRRTTAGIPGIGGGRR
ncbi:efflux RND transporter periplasmic adaptor subunit [bacterium]|nr:HlyD family efflux transporter periplasmic adaptor subunit [bacterium]MBU3956357.1 efflux RND transporter periplasmic adaptor subunit [bacterium]MBU4134481.1 efflux RND transporter periplasmic adaptor subunit [bacterium]